MNRQSAGLQVVQAILPFLEDAVPAVRIAAQTALGIASIAGLLSLWTLPAYDAPLGGTSILWAQTAYASRCHSVCLLNSPRQALAFPPVS